MSNSIQEDLLSIIENYAKEYHEDTLIDEMRLREMELKIPGLKGKWACYKAVNKAQLVKLKNQRDELLDEGVALIKQKKEDEGNPVSLKGAEYILKRSEKYKQLDEKITRLTVLCEYFEDSVKNIQSIGFDVKNLVDTLKLDEM